MDAGLVHFVTTLPLPLLLLLSPGVRVVTAVGIRLLIQAWFTPRELAANAVLGATQYGFIVEVYAVVAALSLVGWWDIYQTASDNLQR